MLNIDNINDDDADDVQLANLPNNLGYCNFKESISSDSIRIISQNIRSLAKNWVTYHELLTESENMPKLIFLQETWTKLGTHNLSNYKHKIFNRDKTSSSKTGGGGVAIYYHNTLNIEFLTNINKQERLRS